MALFRATIAFRSIGTKLNPCWRPQDLDHHRGVAIDSSKDCIRCLHILGLVLLVGMDFLRAC